MLVVGASEGAVVMGTQYYGKGRFEPIVHTIGTAVRFGGAFAGVMFQLHRWKWITKVTREETA